MQIYRVMSVMRPGSLLGSSRCTSSTSSAGAMEGPTLMPTGFAIPRKYSMCAPSLSFEGHKGYEISEQMHGLTTIK